MGLHEPELERKKLVTARTGGMAARPQQLSVATSTGVKWEKPTSTVDSGAFDTVIPPRPLQLCAVIHTPKVGTEYEVANGEVVHNLGERKAVMRITEKSKDELGISSQVDADVHKPPLAMSSIVRQGHKVVFAEQDAHIVLKDGGHIPNETCQWDM